MRALDSLSTRGGRAGCHFRILLRNTRVESALSPAGVNGKAKPFRGVRSRFLPKIDAFWRRITTPT